MPFKHLLITIVISIFSISLSFASGMKVYSHLSNPTWNAFLLEELDQTMSNFSIPYSVRKFKYDGEAITYDNSSVEEFITSDIGLFLQRIEQASGLSILKIKPELAINDLGYEILNIEPSITVSEDGGILFDAEVLIKGIEIEAKSIDINFVLPQLVSDEKIVALQVKMTEPRVSFDPLYSLPLHVKVKLKKVGDQFSIEFPATEMYNLTSSLKQSAHAFDFNFNDLNISDVRLEILGRTVVVQEERIKQTILENKDGLKSLIIEQLATLIQKDGVKAMLNSVQNETFPSSFWLNKNNPTSIPFYLDIARIKAYSNSIVEIDILGDFCTRENYALYAQECTQNKTDNPYSSDYPAESAAQTQQDRQEVLSENKFLVDISENHINNLLSTLIADGVWDELLEDMKIELGPKKAFVKLNNKGDRARVYLDLLYDVGGFKGFVLNQRKVRFPVVLDVDVRVEYFESDYTDKFGTVHHGLYPQLVFRIKDVLLEDRVLRYGYPEYDLPSSIQNVRWGFRGKVIKQIRKELFDYDHETNTQYNTNWIGVDLPPLTMPQLYNLKLEKMKVYNNGHGRLMLIYKGDENLIIPRAF